ncbi:MAG: nuclear transport factor 2 family protein [Flavobacteriaceae bacterium]|jgi:hypothetical protein|nr:nuclear transport factor 2 family protein [Flavobacteriaceae bacterium]
MKKLIFILFFFVGFSAFSQIPEDLIKENIFKIEKALVEKDTIVLQELLHSDLTLGHSNGWIETKESLFEDLKKGKVFYSFFEKVSEVDFTFSSDEMIITRREINAYGTVDEHEFIVKLNVLEVWILQNNSWLLTARQTVNRKK